LMSPLTMTLCPAGGTFTDCVWARVSQATSGSHINTLTDLSNFTFIRDTIRANTIRGSATTFSINAIRCRNCTWTNPVIIQSAATFTTCSNITMTNTTYCEAVSGTTSTITGHVFRVVAGTTRCTFSGLTFPVDNTHPRTAILNLDVAGCSHIRLRNIHTRVAPLNMGTVNPCLHIVNGAVGSAANNVLIQRCYTMNTGTGIQSTDNSNNLIIYENVYGDYADNTDVMASLNMRMNSCGMTGSIAAQTAVYGTMWRDFHNSTTSGRLSIHFNEPTTLNAHTVQLTGGAAFTSVGTLFMPTIGQSATLEMNYFALGHTGFANTALTMSGGTATQYSYDFAIDRNDGNGFSIMTTSAFTPTTLGTALNALTGIDPSRGFRLRLMIRTITTNTAGIENCLITTTSTTASQDIQYPLDTFTLTITGIQPGSDVVIYQAGTETIRHQVGDIVGTINTYIYSTPENVDIGILRAGYIPLYIRNYALGSADASIPVAQVADRAYLE